ncbi:MAG: hypothetical protein NW237_10880 [Cyanobacteriota bacterium]|nr:hypothetical protein [Cyanobacteriota bacterium]
MPPSSADRISFGVCYHRLPLAVYREIAAHLTCVPEINTDLVMNSATTFDYADSQVGSLQIHHPIGADLDPVIQVLDHYGKWQRREGSPGDQPE